MMHPVVQIVLQMQLPLSICQHNYTVKNIRKILEFVEQITLSILCNFCIALIRVVHWMPNYHPDSNKN